MSTSFPVPARQPGHPSHPPRGGTAVIVVRSILLVVAAVAVMATSNYFAYLIGRKQVTYEELRRQVDRIVQLMDQKRVEEELAVSKLKQRHDRFEQNASGLTDLTTSTINGKSIAREPPPAERPTAAALIDDTAVTPPEPKVQPPEISTECHNKTSRRAWPGPTTRFTSSEGFPNVIGTKEWSGRDGVCPTIGPIHTCDLGRTGCGPRRSIIRS